jgi:hypothetical protein
MKVYDEDLGTFLSWDFGEDRKLSCSLSSKGINGNNSKTGLIRTGRLDYP